MRKAAEQVSRSRLFSDIQAGIDMIVCQSGFDAHKENRVLAAAVRAISCPAMPGKSFALPEHFCLESGLQLTNRNALRAFKQNFGSAFQAVAFHFLHWIAAQFSEAITIFSLRQSLLNQLKHGSLPISFFVVEL